MLLTVVGSSRPCRNSLEGLGQRGPPPADRDRGRRAFESVVNQSDFKLECLHEAHMGDGSLLTQVVLVLGASVSLISVSFVRGVLLLHGSTRFRTAPHCGVFSVFVMTVVLGAAF